MYVKRVLPNGVRIISERLDNVRTVSVGIWVGNGSRYEPADVPVQLCGAVFTVDTRTRRCTNVERVKLLD